MRIVSAEDRWTGIALAGIVALALVLRMGWPTLAAFKLDEATVVRRALAIAYEGKLPVTGVDTSTGTDNFPLTLYLMALPLRLWPDPVAVVLFTGLLNGLAVLACYGLARSYFGRTTGVVASFLFAVSPWAVVYGRKIWCQNLPLVTLGFFAAVFATFVQGKSWALVGAFVGLAALIGLHLGGLAFVPILLICMLLYRERVARRSVLVGGLVFTLAISPYVIHDALHGWRNGRDFLNYVGGEAQFSWDALRYAFFMMGSEGIHGMAGNLYPEYLAGLPDLWWLNRVMMGLLAVALLYGLFQVFRGPVERRRPLALMWMWFAVPIAMQSRPTAPVYPFYFNLLYPVQFLFVAILVVDALAHFPRLVGWRSSLPAVLLTAGLLVWGGWQVAVTGRLLLFMDRYPTTGGYGIPLKYTRSAAMEARRLAGASEIIVLSDGTSPAMHETPAVFEALLFDHPHRFADGRWTLPVPHSSEAVYLAGPVKGSLSELGPVLERLEAMKHVRLDSMVALPGGWSYRLFHRAGPDREDVLADVVRFPEAIPFANGTAFMGYGMKEAIRVGETLEVWLAWWVRSPGPYEASYHLFTHLLDAQGGLRSQYDGAGFPTAAWRVGDLVLSRFPIPIPSDLAPGRYRVRAGLYAYPEVVNVPVLDVAGNPTGDGVVLGEVEVVR